MTTVITALYETPNRAALAVQALEAEGVPGEDISLLIGDNFDRDAFAVKTKSKAAEGVAVGATSGAAIGALIGGSPRSGQSRQAAQVCSLQARSSQRLPAQEQEPRPVARSAGSLAPASPSTR